MSAYSRIWFFLAFIFLSLYSPSQAQLFPSIVPEPEEEAIPQKQIDSLKSVISKQPNNVGAHFKLGSIYTDASSFERALEEYSLVGKLKPNYPGLHTNLGLTYYRMGIREWARAVKIDKNYLYKDDGREAFYKKGDKRETLISRYKKQIEKNPSTAQAYYRLRGVYFDIAIEEYKLALKQDSSDVSAHLGLGLTYLERGMKERALAQKKLLDRLSVKDAEALNQMIIYEEEQKQLLEKVIRQEKKPGK